MGLRAILAIAERDVRSTAKDKMALFWIVAFPIFMLTMSFLLWANPMPPVTVKVGIVYEDTTVNWGNLTFTAKNITDIMKEVYVETEEGKVKVFNVVEYGNKTDEALRDLKAGKLDAVVVYLDRFSVNASYGLSAKAEIYVRGGDAYTEQVTRAVLTQFFDELSDRIAEARIEVMEQNLPEDQLPPGQKQMIVEWMKGLAWPVNMTIETVTPETLMGKAGLRGWFTIAMTGVQLLMSGLAIGATMVVEERDRKTLRRLMAAPIGPWDLLLGKTLSGLVWLGISSLVCIGYGLAWGARIYWHPLENPAHALVPVLLLMGGLMMTGLGLLISMVAKTSKGASGLATAIGFPLMFLTGIWMPKWMLPRPLRVFANCFPLTMIVDALRAVMVFDAGLEAVLPVLPWTILATLVFYGLGVLAYKVVLRRSL